MGNSVARSRLAAGAQSGPSLRRFSTAASASIGLKASAHAPRVVVDGHDLYLPNGTGIATYAAELCGQIGALGMGCEALFGAACPDGCDEAERRRRLFASARPPKPASLPTYLFWAFGRGTIAALPAGRAGDAGGLDPCFSRLPTEAVLHNADRLFLRARALFRMTRRPLDVRMRRPPDILHLTRPSPIRVAGVGATITTIHDIAPLLMPEAIATSARFSKSLFEYAVRNSDHIVTVSETVRGQVIERFGARPERVTATYQSAPSADVERAPEERRRALGEAFGLEPRGFHLYYGSIEPRKNIARLVAAYRSSGVERPLVVVSGRSWGSDDAEEALRRNASSDRSGPGVIRLDHLPAPDLRLLIGSARAVLTPSLIEGFCLPVVEGFVHQTPVLTSAGGATEEIAGGAAHLVDPFDVKAIAEGIALIDRDDALREALVERGRERALFFSPDRQAARLGAVYGRLLDRSRCATSEG